MKKLLFPLIAAMLMCAACVATVGPHGTSVTVAPPLPVVVELEDPYYVHGGYYYYYNNDRWYYSQSRGGRWIDLPRDRYPREVRYKRGGGDRDKGYEDRHDRGRGHDRD